MKHFFLRIICGRKREKRKNSKAREKQRVVVDDGRCACCLAPFLVGRGVRCSDCGARSCRKACSRWDTSDNAWHCIFCHQQRSWLKRNDKWFDNFGGTANEEEEPHGYFGAVKSRVYVAGHATAISNVERIQEDREERRMVHAVRNFVEKIVDGLVENVDDTPIDRLYGDSEYDSFLEEYRPPLIAALTRLATCLKASLTNKPSTDPPAMAHAALREIVERAVEEARKLPGLSASANPPEHPPERRAVADNSYEDLLATAILNKVIERYQRERVDGNSNVLRDTDSPKAKYTANENEHGLEEDATSYASDRLTCNGDHSAAIRRNEDRRKPVSFTMEERIEEVTTITSDDDELRDNDALAFGCTRRVPFPEYGMDIVDPPRKLPSPSPSSSSDSSDLNRNEYSPVRTKRHAVGRTIDIVSPIESWEDNWLFQKKKTSRSQPDAVAMLVPSSNAYYKALIGDRDAEDTSDLSECSSTKSDEEIEKELMEAINNVIPRTPRISECDATNNQTKSNQEGATTAQQFEKDEVDTCQAKTENNVTISECRGGKNHEGLLKSSEISEKKINERKDDESNRNESLFALTTVAKEGDKTKEKHKDTAERGERTIATAVESSAQKEVKVQSEKSSERSDRGENVADENEEQRESEYTEHYDTAIQRHLDSLTKVEVCSGESETIDETRKTTDEQPGKLENNSIKELKNERSETGVQSSYATIDENHADVMSENDPLSAPPRPGTIAEREHKKWENAPPIENNPYSEESIRKRCLERQYSRNSDMPGTHYELTKLNEVNLETLLTASRPDIKRFGRDYYINQSKGASGEQQEQAKSAMSSMSSRPSSSLSQRSSCAGDEQHERQEESASKEINDGISVLQSDKDTKTSASWHRNNAEVISPETNNRAVISRAPVDVGDHQKVRSETNAPDKTTWQDQRTDDILENQRKNSKNEINAKLNNQEQSVETERKDDKERIVRRIDLKAYGFANEFSDQRTPTRQQRVVNRLDLSSFGYQDGLRRARSNNQLDQPLRNNAKSNLTRRAYKGHLNDTPRSLGWDFAKSSGGLNELRDEVEEMNSRLTSAKSMPNVADDVCYYANPVYVNDTQDELTAKNLLDLAEESATTEKRDAIIGDDTSLLNDYDEIPPDVDRSFEDIYIGTKAQSGETEDDESRAMPSVKRLAKAFGRRQTSEIETAVPAKIIRASVAKVDDAKDRSFTPEVQIVETPRQMHSLTARSLSREFREGLRQMPGKLTSPPVSRSLIEERPTNRTEVVRSKQEGNDTAVISPGKLKSNIIFWEQMQKRN